jgi:hypothetical protein
MQPFVISGKAKEVFRLLEIKGAYAKEARQELNGQIEQYFPQLGAITLLVDKDGGHICPWGGIGRCTVDDSAICAKAKCEPWVKLFENVERDGE